MFLMFVALIKRIKNGSTSERDIIKLVNGISSRPESFLSDLNKVVMAWQRSTGSPVEGLTEAQKEEFWKFAEMAKKVRK